MSRPRLIRSLRIAWTAWWSIVCLLLVVLWVRSFWRTDTCAYSFGSVTCAATSLRGCIVLYGGKTNGANLTGYDSMPASISSLDSDIPGAYFWFRLTKTPTDLTLLAPMWFYLAAAASFAVAPLLRSRFSLRTLLIATTLIAVVLGLAVFLGR